MVSKLDKWAQSGHMYHPWCADRDLGGFWRVVDLAQGGVALVHVTCWGRTTHVGGPEDARLQDYQVSSVRCHRFVTVTAAQKISFISNPRAGRPALQYILLLFIVLERRIHVPV